MRSFPRVAHVSFPLFLSLLTILSGGNAFQIAPVTSVSHTRRTSCAGRTSNSGLYASSSSSGSNSAKVPQQQQQEAPIGPPPILNGKTVLPIKVLQKGLEGHTIAAVYALLSSDFKKGTSGWEHVINVATTLDLAADLDENTVQDGAAHVRALSFVFPQRDAMEDVAAEWRESVQAAGGVMKAPVVDPDAMLRQAQMNALSAFDDDEEDDDDDDDDIDMMMPPPPSLQKSTTTTATDTVISPFAEGAAGMENRNLPFTSESVNLVLDEVRPYLIADGGNVSVDRVDEATKNVYLKLEGACGSCPSSTVTMQMGIERVLKENFPNLGQVIQIDGGVEKPSELTVDMVMLEINRIGPAISAMGGNYELVRVDPIGEVELKFKGPNKLQQGLELALLDIPLCKHVKFTIFDE